jgi:nicotinamidase-related amidase
LTGAFTGASGRAGLLVWTRAVYSDGYADTLRRPVDLPLKLPEGGFARDDLAFDARFARSSPDLAITKRQWSAFCGTQLDLQFGRRGIENVIIGAVMTNFGVESTARNAWQNNYAVLVAEDACSSLSDDTHRFSMERILPPRGPRALRGSTGRGAGLAAPPAIGAAARCQSA